METSLIIRNSARDCKSIKEDNVDKTVWLTGHEQSTNSSRAVPRLTRHQTGTFLAALMASVAIFASTDAYASELLDLGTLNGGSEANPSAISADGTTITGVAKDGNANNVERAFRWTQADGITSLGTFNNGNVSSGYGVNADGSVIVGLAADGNANNEYRAFRWTKADGLVNLGTLNGGSQSIARGVNYDGTVVVGVAKDGSQGDIDRAFRWTSAGGMVSLGTLTGGFESTGTGVNADGSVVVGTADDGANNRAFRWTQASGMVNLGILPGDVESAATAVNANGAVVVGFSTASDALPTAFRWTQAQGMTALVPHDGQSVSMALGVNADGSVVVGSFNVGLDSRGFRWTEEDGMASVDDWLRENGVSLPNDVTAEAHAVSADGNIVTGFLTNNHLFIARGPSDTTTAGLMDVTNFQQSLVSTPRVSGQLQNADVVINGAHSSPLFMLLDAGQSSAWFTGDGGYTSMKSAQGGIGAGEFGFGRGIEGGWTVRFAGGGQYARMDTPNAGNSVFSSGYIAPDVSYAVGGGVVATLSGYLNWGKADVRRGYLNGAANDSSFGSTATQTYGVRARLDWQDALKLASTCISPFVSYTYLNSQMNGYTETGGSFPVRFDGSREISNAVRIGADATTPLNDQFSLVTRFEYGHRFEKAGAGVSGQILGLTAFSMDGASVQQDWLRGGLGVSYKLGQGDGLVMVNSSNQTGKNTTWVSASYRMKF